MAKLESLLTYVASEGPVCPKPDAWVELRDMLGPDSPQIAILAGWWAVPPGFKALMLDAQIRFAAEHGKLGRVDRFLRGLPDREWFRCDSFREHQKQQRRGQLDLPL